MNTREIAKKLQGYTVQMRREFHMCPELPMEERETSEKICRELESMGIPYEIVGDYCVVGKLDFGPGKKLAIRADIDALPVQELVDVPWKSKKDGVMHACGHDAHGAMLLATAKGLLEMRDTMTGTIYLCFQQAEEIGACADICVQYLQAQGGVDNVVGIHVQAGIAVGEMDIQVGARCSGAEIFYIDIEGRGGHGSRMDLTIDPLEVACEIYQKIKLIPLYHHSLFDTSVVSVCMLSGGSRFNVVADTAHMEGTIRYYTVGDGDIILEKIREVADHVASFHGATVTVTNRSGAKCPVVNESKSTQLAQKCAQDVGLSLAMVPPIAGSDNFGEYLYEFPGCYCNLGVKSSREGTSGNHHNATFDIDENGLEYGVAFFMEYAKQFLQ